MPTFTPPVTDSVPADYIPAGPAGNDRYLPADPLIRRLMGRFHANGKAPNVWKLLDGTFTTQQPYEAIPGTVIATVYLGAHTYVVTAAEATALTAAGYTVIS